MRLPGAPEVAYRGNTLHLEDLSMAELARRYGTPLYAYSSASMTRALASYERALVGRDHLVCYSV